MQQHVAAMGMGSTGHVILAQHRSCYLGHELVDVSTPLSWCFSLESSREKHSHSHSRTSLFTTTLVQSDRVAPAHMVDIAHHPAVMQANG